MNRIKRFFHYYFGKKATFYYDRWHWYDEAKDEIYVKRYEMQRCQIPRSWEKENLGFDISHHLGYPETLPPNNTEIIYHNCYTRSAKNALWIKSAEAASEAIEQRRSPARYWFKAFPDLKRET